MEREEKAIVCNALLEKKQVDFPGGKLCCLYKDTEKMCLQAEGKALEEQCIDVKMLLYNQITGFLSFQIQYIDERQVYSYSTEGMITLEEMIQNTEIDFILTREIYRGILAASRKGKEYFLNEAHFVLEPSHLFWDLRKKQIRICYFPEYSISLDDQMVNLSQILLKKIEHRDKRGTSFLYGIYELIEREGFVNPDIAEYLKGYGESEEKEWETKGDSGKGELDLERQDVFRMRDKVLNNAVAEKGRKPKHREERNKGTEIRTGLRNVSKWKGLPDWVEVDHDSFTIGRGEGNDFILPAAQISCQHARIDKKQSQIYITDLNSTNGVYINGKKLLRNHPVLCREKDIISFADIAYCLERQ